MRDNIHTLIKKNKFLIKLYHRIKNKFIGNNENFNFLPLLITNNTFINNGTNNSINISDECSIQNNVIAVDGDNNIITFEKGSTLTGNGKSSIRIAGSNNSIIVHNNSKIDYSSFFISGSNNIIEIGSDCSVMISDFQVVQCNNKIIVANGSTFHGREYKSIHIVADEGTEVIIGEDCMLSNNIQLRSSDSHSIVDMSGKRLNRAKNITIGNHVWIGLNSVLLKGAVIPDNTVVAAGSICTKEYTEKNTIIAGNPAKSIKHNINWDRKFIIN